MAFTAAQIMSKASTILQDAGAIRWTPPELLTWLNEALIEVAVQKPNARTEVAVLDLVAGTQQELPPDYTTLARVLRNKRVSTGGRAISMIAKRELLDASIPNWQDSTQMPNAADVAYVIHDLAAPRSFLVVPGNDGTGKIEAIVGRNPTPVPAPGNPLLIESYTGAVDLPDIYQGVVTDLLLARAFSKDSGAPDAAQRAVAHFQKASAAIQAITAGETAMSPAAAG